ILAEAPQSPKSASSKVASATTSSPVAGSRPRPAPKPGPTSTPLGTPDPPKDGGDKARRPLPPDWKVLVPDGTGSERSEGPNKAENSLPQPPNSRGKPGLTLDALCKKLGIPDDKCIVANADDALRSAGRHNWPPII